MRTRRTGLFGAAVCTMFIGVGSAAWACVPGHDHTGANDTDHAAHAAAQAPAAPVITVAPVEEPVAAPQEQATTSPAAPTTPATAAPAPVATRTAPVTAAPAPVAASPAPAAVVTPAPAASVMPVPEAVAPATPATTAWQPRVLAEVPASQESSGSGTSVGGVLLAGFGLAVLVLGGAFAIRWRHNLAPPAILPD